MITDDLNDAGNPTTTAVSLLDSSRDEFPVLKAFQQYIDAEQAKARKRMYGLSAFFITLIIVFTAAFVTVLGWLIQRNQKLEDRIFEMTEKERDRSAESARLLAERTEEARKAGAAAATAAMNGRLALGGEPSMDALKPLLAKLERERDEMKAKFEAEKRALESKAEKERLRAEKEKARQDEIERHRRRLYPDYYARLEGKTIPEARPVAASPRVTEPIEEEPEELPRVQPKRPSRSAYRNAMSAKKRPTDIKGLKPVSYFSDAPTESPADAEAPAEEEAPAPKPIVAKPKPKTPPKKYTTVEIKGDDGETIPFLIDLSEEK